MSHYPGVECRHGYDACPICDKAPTDTLIEAARSFQQRLAKRDCTCPRCMGDKCYCAVMGRMAPCSVCTNSCDPDNPSTRTGRCPVCGCQECGCAGPR